MAQNMQPPTDNGLTRRRPHQIMNRRRTFALLAAVVILGLVGWMYLSQASEAAELHHHIQELHQRKDELQRQNDQLAYDIARTASVDQLESRARQLGYVYVWQARFVAVVGYPSQDKKAPEDVAALAQRDPAERATSPTVTGWWRSVTDQFEAWTQTE